MLHSVCGLEGAILLPGSYLHLHVQMNCTHSTSQEQNGNKSSTFHPLKIPSFNSVIVNTSIYDPITFRNLII